MAWLRHRRLTAEERERRLTAEEREREFVAFATEHVQRGLFRAAYVLTGDRAAAEDLVQETLTVLLARWERVDPERVEAYARTILRNLAIDEYRRRHGRARRTALVPLDLVTAEKLDKLDFTRFYTRLFDDDMVQEIQVLQALSQLTPPQLQVIVLRFWADLSVAETADLAGISRSMVKSHVNKAFKTLRALLSEEAER